MPWAWFLSATTPAAKLLLVARAWLLLKVALATLCPAADETKLSATLTLISSETELEAETEASATDALVSTLSCSREVVVLALSSLAGALLSDTFVAGSVLADLPVKTELLADTDWLTETELLAETDWLSDWLTDWLVEMLRETDSLVETEALADWATETEANSEACSAFAFRISACACAIIELVLASVASSLSLTSAEITALSVYSDVSSAYTDCSWVTISPAAPAANIPPRPARVLRLRWSWSSSSVSDKLLETTSPIPPIRKRSSWEFEAFTQFFPDL